MNEETDTQCASIEHVPHLVSLLIAQSLNVRCRCYGRGAAVGESERKHERSRNCLEGCPRTRNWFFSHEWQDHQGPHLSQQKSYSERKRSQFIFVEFEGRDRLAMCICWVQTIRRTHIVACLKREANKETRRRKHWADWYLIPQLADGYWTHRSPPYDRPPYDRPPYDRPPYVCVLWHNITLCKQFHKCAHDTT